MYVVAPSVTGIYTHMASQFEEVVKQYYFHRILVNICPCCSNNTSVTSLLQCLQFLGTVLRQSQTEIRIVKLASKFLHNIHIEINVYFMQDF